MLFQLFHFSFKFRFKDFEIWDGVNDDLYSEYFKIDTILLDFDC